MKRRAANGDWGWVVRRLSEDWDFLEQGLPFQTLTPKENPDTNLQEESKLNVSKKGCSDDVGGRVRVSVSVSDIKGYDYGYMDSGISFRNFENFFVWLPMELVFYVVSFLDTNTSLSFRNTCKSLYQSIWESQDRLDFYNEITDKELEIILNNCAKDSLESIEFHFHSDSGITDHGIHLLSAFPKLQNLHFHQCRFPSFTDRGSQHLPSLPNLRALNLHGCTSLTSKTLKSLSSLPNLEHLSLDVDSTANFRHLLPLTHLTSLALWAKQDYYYIPLMDIPVSLGLSSLTLSWFAFEKGSPEFMRLSGFEGLKYLQLQQCFGIDCLAPEIKQLSHLEVLKLKDSEVSDYFAEHLAQLTNLVYLHLGNFRGHFGPLMGLKLKELMMDSSF